MPNPFAPPDPTAPPPPQKRPEDYPRGGNDGSHPEGGQDSASGSWPDPNDQQHSRPHGGPNGQRQPSGQGGPSGKPKRTPPSPEQAIAAGKGVLKFGVMLFVALLTMRWPLPWQVAAPIAGAFATYLGIRAAITYRKFGLSSFTWIFLLLGVAASALLTIASLSMVVAWNTQSEYQECTSRALTVQAEQTCTSDYQKSLQERLTPSNS